MTAIQGGKWALLGANQQSGHHQPDGHEYSPASKPSESILPAVKQSGISITHLPVLYMSSGFSGASLQDQQKRFGCTADQHLHLLRGIQADILVLDTGTALINHR